MWNGKRNPELTLQLLYNDIQNDLTPAARRMLSLLLVHEHGGGLTRKQIAQLKNKPYLNRYDISLLDHLESKFYIMSDVSYSHEEAEYLGSAGGRRTPPTWNYVYYVNDKLRPYFKEISKRAKRQQSEGTPLLIRLRDLLA